MKTFLNKIHRRFPPLNVWLLSVVLVEFIQTLYFILGRRIVSHDTLFSFTLQYYFLNNAVMSGEIPQWIPQITQGTTAAWWHTFQGVNGILTYALFLFSGLLKHVNFLTVFYVSMFFDKLLLICGVWLLSKYYYSSRFTAFFVTASVAASSIWTSQSFFNLRLYYALPLIIYLGHTFLKTGKWRYCCLAFNLFVIQIFGNAAYFIPISTLTLFLYFSFYAICNPGEIKKQIQHINWRSPFVLSMLIIAACSFLIYYFLKTGFDAQLVYCGQQRGADALVGLKIFLTWGKDNPAFRWFELVLGYSPFRDCTLYIGIFMLPMIILALVYNLNRQSLPILVLIVVLLLLSLSTIVSVFFYHVWPLMKYYRHLFLVAPLIRVWLCFLGGFGFDTICRNGSVKNNYKHLPKPALAITVFFLVGLAVMLINISRDSRSLVSLMRAMTLTQPIDDFGDLRVLSELIKIASDKALFAASLIIFLIWFYLKPRYQRVIVLILCFHAMDVFMYAIYENTRRTGYLSEQQNQENTFQSFPFARRRNMLPWWKHPRAKTLSADVLWRSTIYCEIDAYLFNDQLGTSLRTDHWQSPLNDFMKAFWGQSLPDTRVPPLGWQNRKLIFPIRHPGARKFSGLDEDKIQFFSDAYLINDRNKLAAILSDANYTGDILFLSSPSKDSGSKAAVKEWSSRVSLVDNQRLKLPYDVLRFDANHLEISTVVPGKDPAWIFYSDVWHPFWRATVNGKPAKVFKACLAYKAVAIQPGKNQIHFFFKSKLTEFLLFFLGLNSLFWVWWTIRKMAKEIIPGEEVSGMKEGA